MSDKLTDVTPRELEIWDRIYAAVCPVTDPAHACRKANEAIMHMWEHGPELADGKITMHAERAEFERFIEWQKNAHKPVTELTADDVKAGMMTKEEFLKAVCTAPPPTVQPSHQSVDESF